MSDQKKKLSLDELYELAKLQEEKEQRQEMNRKLVDAARQHKAQVDSRTETKKITQSEFYNEMAQAKAFGVTLGKGRLHNIELIEL